MGDYAHNSETKQSHDGKKTTREMIADALNEKTSYFTRMAEPCDLCGDTRKVGGHHPCPACKDKPRMGR